MDLYNVGVDELRPCELPDDQHRYRWMVYEIRRCVDEISGSAVLLDWDGVIHYPSILSCGHLSPYSWDVEMPVDNYRKAGAVGNVHAKARQLIGL